MKLKRLAGSGVCSYAAGPGLRPRVPGSPRPAGRSSANYAHLVARRLGLDLDDVTYSGATTADLLQTSAAGQPAQLDAITPDTRLVTITAGGNDVGYLPRLTLSSLPWPLRVLPPVRTRVRDWGDQNAMDDRFAQLERNLGTIAHRLRPPPGEIAQWGRAIARRLSATTRAAAEAAGWEYVAASEASADHHAWSAVIDASSPIGDEQSVRELVIKQIERKRRFHMHAVSYAAVSILLVIVWAISEYNNAGGWPTDGFRQSSSIRHVWNIWIIYPVLGLGVILAIDAWHTYGKKPISEHEIDRLTGRFTARHG